MRIDNIRLLTNRFPESFAFYRDVMRFKVTWGEPDGNYASFSGNNGTTSIGLFARDLMSQAVRTTHLPLEVNAQDRVALVFEVDHLDEFATHVTQAGLTLINQPKDMPDWGTRTAHLRDPDGNLLEVFMPLPKPEWSQELRDEGERQNP